MRPDSEGTAGIGWRAIAIGALLIPVNAVWIDTSELLWGGAWPDAASLLFNTVLILLVLALANLPLRRWLPHWALSPSELVVVYVMLCLGTAICGHDFLQVLLILLTTATYYGSPENNWQELFADQLPSSLLVTDPRAAVDFWQGDANLYTMEAIRPWLIPVGTWILFTIALLTVMMGIDALVLKRWNDEEKLSYPLLEVPVQLTRPGFDLIGPQLLGNSLLWIGFAMAAGIDLLNGFANLYPNIPELHVTMIDLSPMLKTFPWNAMGWTVVAVYPFAIGLGYLMPKDFLFSCWFFYWFWKLERVIGYVVGQQRIDFPYITEQAYGAYIGIGVFALWTGRHYFADVFRGLAGAAGGENGGIPYGLIVGAIGVGLLFLLIFATSIMGVTLASAVLFFGGYLLLIFSITRMRAEFGLPVHDFWTGPLAISISIAGARPFGRRNLIAMSPLFWMVRSQRSQPMPHGLEAMTLGRRRGLSIPAMLAVVAVAVLVGTVSGFWSMIHIGYTYGMGLDPNSDAIYLAKPAFSRAASWTKMPPPAHWNRAAGIAGGFIFTVTLLLLRLRFLWWPLHPAGYAASSMRFMGLLWLPMLIAWLIKTSVMRYGGYKLYQRLYPFFLGLILGEFVVGGLWGLAGTLGRFPTYRFWPY
ncbi:MAG: DUF6785 family protein [Armatimonadota bacterium]|nr:DUF6785 family protein [Armatimonadota bacterium]